MDRCEKYRKMAKFLGVEMNVPFNVKAPNGYIYGCPYRITENGIYDRSGNVAQLNQLGAMFSCQSIEICDKEAWHMGSEFYYIGVSGDISKGRLTYNLLQIRLMGYGNIFHTKEEAEKYSSKIKAMLNNRK